MFGLLKSAGLAVAGIFFKQASLKWLAMLVIFLIVEGLIAVVAQLLPEQFSLAGLASQINSDVWWFLNLVQFSFGVQVMMGAYVSRFMIRRLPFVG